MPKAFTEREKEIIQRRLLEEAYRLFSAHGLKKTNVEELAEAAGISKGAFYLFCDSKEALFMDVVEIAELRYREDVLAAVDLPGPSPRARLLALLKRAFNLFQTVPLLRFMTGEDVDVLARRMPQDKLMEHTASDRVFIETLIDRCRSAGIPIQISLAQFTGLLYAIVLNVLHEKDFGQYTMDGTVDLLLELVAAYCLGEVKLEGKNESGH